MHEKIKDAFNIDIFVWNEKFKYLINTLIAIGTQIEEYHTLNLNLLYKLSTIIEKYESNMWVHMATNKGYLS